MLFRFFGVALFFSLSQSTSLSGSVILQSKTTVNVMAARVFHLVSVRILYFSKHEKNCVGNFGAAHMVLNRQRRALGELYSEFKCDGEQLL